MGQSGQVWIAWLLLVPIAGITMVGIFCSFYGWPHLLELLSHLQWQYWILSLLLLGLLLLTRRWLPIGIAMALILLQTLQIVPWYLTSPLAALGTPLDHAPDLRVLLANINTMNRSYDLVIEFIQQENPDVLLLMEVSDNWITPLQALQETLPYSFSQTGNYFFSRYPLQNTRFDYFGTERTAAVLAQIRLQDRSVTLIGAHPLPPLYPDLFHARNRQLDGIAQLIRTLSEPVILMGDFNVTLWSPYYRRLIQITGLDNTRFGFGILPTWPTPGTFPLGFSSFLRIPIDHCLVSDEFDTLDTRIGPTIDSDHFPMIVDLALQP